MDIDKLFSQPESRKLEFNREHEIVYLKASYIRILNQQNRECPSSMLLQA